MKLDLSLPDMPEFPFAIPDIPDFAGDMKRALDAQAKQWIFENHLRDFAAAFALPESQRAAAIAKANDAANKSMAMLQEKP